MKSFVLLLVLTIGMLPSGYKVGDKVEDFNLRNVDGKMVSLQNLGEVKGAIVVFTCNTCPYSKLYEDRIIELHNEYSSKGYPVVAIQPNDPKKSPGDSFDKMKARSKSKGFPFAYVIDETQEVSKAFGATNTPHTYILGKEKNDFVVKYIGAIDSNARGATDDTDKYVEDALDQLLSGQEVELTSTKAIGCSIKWR